MGWRGGSSGGESTGRSGRKRGGREGTPDPNDQQSTKPTKCPTCRGAKRLAKKNLEKDEGGFFDGEQYEDCWGCGGTGEA